MKNLMSVFAVLAASCAFGEMTAKTSWTQRWPWNTKVDIDFTLSGGEKCDVAVTATFTTNGVAGSVDLERTGAKGDLWELEPGQYHLVWDPAAAGLDVEELKDFAVQVTPVENAATTRKWLVLDIVDGTWEYLADEPDGGWTDEHKRSKMVFRRIPAGSFTAGLTSEEVAYLDAPNDHSGGYYCPQKTMTILHDYYIAIYKTTMAQKYRMDDPASTQSTMWPHVSLDTYYPYLRGSNSVDGIDWPVTRFTVKSGSIIDDFRARFNYRFWIDLPTSMQWEKAARAGTTTFWHNGGAVGTSYEECTNLINAIAYSCINTNVAQYNRTDVGSYLANDYGLCDVVGMRPEYVLDRFVNQDTVAAETYDPVGPTNGTRRALRSQHNVIGNTLRYYTHAQIGVDYIDNTAKNTYQAFRFAIHLRPPQSFGGKWE